MSIEARFEIELLGYRNDLARERAIAFMRSLSDDQGGPIRVHRETVLPQIIASDLDQAHALRLAAKLRERGAQINVRGEDVDVPGLETPDPRSSSPSLKLLVATLGLVLLFAAVRLQQERRPAIAPKAPAGSNDTLVIADPGIPLERHRLNEEAVGLNASGQYEEAVELLYAAIERDPEEGILRGNLVTVLRNWAVQELNGGDTAVAINLLTEALEVTEHTSLVALLGIAQERTGNVYDAEVTLEKAIEMGTNDPMAFVALGRIYRQQGHQQGAVEMFHRARETGAKGRDFDTMLEKLERELDAEWDFVDFSTPHFRLSFAQGEDHHAAEVVSEVLEDAYFAVGRKLDLFPELPTEVVLYAAEDFHEVTQTPDWTGGVYDGRIKLPVRGIAAGSKLLERTLRHEYGHVLVTKLGHGRIPVWLNEGLAIWAEEERDGDRQSWAYDIIAGQRLFSLHELIPPFTRLPADRVQVAYAQSYLAVRAILTDYGERRLLALLTSAGTAGALDSAFENVLAIPLSEFEARLIEKLTR